MFIKRLLLSFILFLLSTQASIYAQKNSIYRIDSLTHVFMSQTLTKPQVGLTTDEVLTLTESKFNEMVSTLGTTISFKFDETVRTQMHYMKHPSSSFLKKAQSKKNVYFRVFEEVLDRKGMPDEIKYLSIVESLLSANAVSWCGATGLWQFMPATGRMMDLTINSEVDERKDLYKSTEKACDYLLSMYNLYGDWLLALSAYNGGPGNVNKAIRRSGGKKTFWEIKPYLPKETQQYVPKFLATAFLMTFSPPESEENSHLLKEHETLVPVVMCCEVDMKYICAVVELNEFERQEWNNTYTSGLIPSTMAAKNVVLPYNKAMKLAEWQDSIYNIVTQSFSPKKYIQNKTETVFHSVKKGQNLPIIAEKYGVSVSQIKNWNRLKSSKVSVGRKLRIIKTSHEILPIKVNESTTFLYYLTENANESIQDLCSRFKEFDIDKTCIENGIETPLTPIEKGKLIKLYLNNSI
jgi:membrane-bound lytic murein transglycosylase D